ncbi:hypothetical protein MNEG_12014, partial [Monoraphidium neglectum]
GRIVLGAAVEDAVHAPAELGRAAALFKSERFVITYRPESKKARGGRAAPGGVGAGLERGGAARSPALGRGGGGSGWPLGGGRRGCMARAWPELTLGVGGETCEGARGGRAQHQGAERGPPLLPLVASGSIH